jgi:hypothetical protein
MYRISWARMLVLIFLSKTELLFLLDYTGITRDSGESFHTPETWYKVAMTELKQKVCFFLNKSHDIKVGNMFKDFCEEFDDICRELHRLRSGNLSPGSDMNMESSASRALYTSSSM